MSAPERRQFRFGDITLDLDRGRITANSREISLRPKSFALLSYLAGNAGRVLSKDELVSAIWPDVAVTDDSLTRCIHEIRRCLGDAGATLLRTVPRRGYLFEMPEEVVSRTTAITVSAPDPDDVAKPTPQNFRQSAVAILPFEFDMGIAIEDRQRLDGLVHDIIGQMSRLRSFNVIARGSVFALRHLAGDPRQLGDLLNVAYMVGGTVELRGAQLVLHIDLVQTSGGIIVWSDEIPIRSADVPAMIGTLTERIVSAIAAHITIAERTRARYVADQALDAWQTYHRGLNHVFHFEKEQMAQALHYFERAATLDPGFTRAHASRSFCHYFYAFSGQCADRDAEARAAMKTAELAMQVDESNPVSHWAYGRALFLHGNPEAGLRHSKHAVSLCPGFVHALYMVGFLEANFGSPHESLAILDRTEALSPFDPFLGSIQLTRGVALFKTGHLKEAAVWARKAAYQSNSYSQMQGNAAVILATAGHVAEAREIVRSIHLTQPDYNISTLLQAIYGLSDDERALFRREASLIGL